MATMPKKRPKYTQFEKTRHDRFVWYFRRPGEPRIRLPDAYDTPEFWEAYNAALAGTSKPKSAALPQHRRGTLAWLIRQYKQSSAFADLADNTRKTRDAILRKVEKTGGGLTAANITEKHIRAGIEARAGKPGGQRNFLQTMRALFQWAMPDHVERDPTAGFRVKMPKTHGHKIWTVEMIERFHARHPLGTKARLAMDLALYTGLRRSDVCRIGPQHISNGVLTIRTQKSGEMVEIVLPVLEPLRESIAAATIGNLAFIVTEYGRPFSVAGFGAWFADRCIEAGVDGRAHGLRKAAATFAAENGATPHDLNAIFGWSGIQQAELYTRAANRRKAAMSKAHLMLPDHLRNKNTRTTDEGAGGSEESATKSAI